VRRGGGRLDPAPPLGSFFRAHQLQEASNATGQCRRRNAASDLPPGDIAPPRVGSRRNDQYGQESVNGTPVTWMEQVSDEQYLAPSME
jgi:hypothetical protein